MGKRRRRARQKTMWVASADLPRSAGHPFYERLNRLLDDAGFDAFVEGQGAPFYADGVGRPSLAPGRYFRLLLLGYFEGLDSERAIAWRAADSLSIRQFLDRELHEAPPDHSTLSRTRRCDRRGDAPSGVYVGVAATGRRPVGEGPDARDRCDDVGGQCGDAEHRAPGHRHGESAADRAVSVGGLRDPEHLVRRAPQPHDSAGVGVLAPPLTLPRSWRRPAPRARRTLALPLQLHPAAQGVEVRSRDPDACDAGRAGERADELARHLHGAPCQSACSCGARRPRRRWPTWWSPAYQSTP